MAIALVVAAGLSAAAFVARGGFQLGPTTWVEIVALLLGTLVAAAALVVAPLRSRFWGGLTLALLLALAAWTAASTAWSIEPSDSWVEANRTLSYAAVFAGGLGLVRLFPERWGALLAGVLLACVTVCGYGVLTKVFPGALDPSQFYSRLQAPVGYWNAAGLTAASGIPICLWLGARRAGHNAVNALAYPALGLLIVTLMLSYSRGALAVVLIGLAVWFALVPLRLRAFVVLLVSALPAGAVTAWAFTQDALTKDNVIVSVRADAGHELGVLVALMMILLLLAGLTVGFLQAARPLSPRARTRWGIVVLVGVALLPAAGVVAMALSDKGIGGTVTDTWERFTDPDAGVPSNDPGRLTAAGSVRARYWRDATELWEAEPVLGQGAGAYATGRFRVRQDVGVVRHAHGYVHQTLADLGIVGIALSVLGMLAWLWAASRTLGLGWRGRKRTRVPADNPERIALTTLAVVALIFGIHSLVDWTWFIPVNAMTGLLCAGWVAGRGPALQPALPVPAGRARVLRLASAVGLVLVALVAAWAMWQPLRSANTGRDALDALEAGRRSEARDKARDAADINPLAVEPLFELSAVEEASFREPQARAALLDAVELQPANPQAWIRLATFELRVGRPRAALVAARAALFLDPQSPQTRRLFLRTVRANQPAPAPAPAPAPGVPPAPGAPAPAPGAPAPAPAPPAPAPGTSGSD